MAQAPDSAGVPAPAHGKRRQYAAGQTQAYYGAADGYAGGDGGYGAQGQQQAAGGQLFTPGLAAPNQFQMQQEQAQVGAGQAGYYGQPDIQQQHQPAYPGAQDMQAPGYGHAGGVGQLADQFGHMGLAGGKAQLHTANLLTSPPDPNVLNHPPPEIVLPPNSSVSPSPLANSHYSYQRSTLNAVPTTSSLLSKSKIPLALVLTPYRSVAESEEQVPVVTDTVIARCRRCRTYINPYVQFIDGGNRQVLPDLAQDVY